MACIFKRGKTWSYSVDIGRDETGKRKKKGKGGYRTQREAKEAAALLEVDIAGGTFVDEKKITFSIFADQWFLEYENGVRHTTARLRKADMERLKKVFGDQFLKDITKLQYQSFLLSLFEYGYSDSTMQGINNTANLIFKKACEYEIIKSSPTMYTTIPKKKATVEELENSNDIPKYLEKEDLFLFLKTAKENYSHTDYIIFLILSYTGMRRGELLALKWGDIDFKSNVIRIRKTIDTNVSSVKNYIIGPPKTKHSKRDILITDEIIRELSKHRTNQRKEKLKHRQKWNDENFIFTSERIYGYPMSGTVVKNKMKNILTLAKLNTTFSPHSLRHTHTSLLAEAKVPLEAIMERLGHADDKVTRLIYLHITKGIKKDTIQKFQQLMNSI